MKILEMVFCRTALVILICAVCGVPSFALAQKARKAGVSVISEATQRIRVSMGQSVLVNTQTFISQVSLAEPEIADSILLSPRQVYVVGKGIGRTTLTLWDSTRQNASVIEVEVTPDVVGLKTRLQEILPQEPIRVTAAHDGLTLYGEVSSAVNMERALAVAEVFAPNKVANLMQVSGVHQVMLEVRVAEMASTLTKRLGINFGAFADGNLFGVSMLDRLATFSLDQELGQNIFTFSENINALLDFQAGGVDVSAFIDALKEDGLTKVLAEPTLVTLSGQNASFLAGGEFPVPVPQDNNVTIEFRSFGVALNFTPTVLSADKISIQVAPEVSELDFSNAVTVAGLRIPAIAIRRASTVIELGDGQSFAIAGLLQESVRETVAKFPVLGEIPILGALFRSSSFERGETELVIIVTPRLVKPIDVAKQPLPTDGYVEPNDIDFFLFGKLQGKGGTRGRWGLLDGAFGYISSPQGVSP